MENNYKEFIQKIKYMVEYDTSKTREDNQIITEGIITEEDTPKLKGIEEAQKIINKIRAKHKNDKNWDEFIGGFVERINDAFNVNEGEEVNENVPPRPPVPSATLKQGELPREDKRRKSITFINERLDHWVGEYLNEDNLGDDKTYKVPEKAKMQIENLLNEVGKLTALIQGR